MKKLFIILATAVASFAFASATFAQTTVGTIPAGIVFNNGTFFSGPAGNSFAGVMAYNYLSDADPTSAIQSALPYWARITNGSYDGCNEYTGIHYWRYTLEILPGENPGDGVLVHYIQGISEFGYSYQDVLVRYPR